MSFGVINNASRATDLNSGVLISTVNMSYSICCKGIHRGGGGGGGGGWGGSLNVQRTLMHPPHLKYQIAHVR